MAEATGGALREKELSAAMDGSAADKPDQPAPASSPSLSSAHLQRLFEMEDRRRMSDIRAEMDDDADTTDDDDHFYGDFPRHPFGAHPGHSFSPSHGGGSSASMAAGARAGRRSREMSMLRRAMTADRAHQPLRSSLMSATPSLAAAAAIVPPSMIEQVRAASATAQAAVDSVAAAAAANQPVSMEQQQATMQAVLAEQKAVLQAQAALIAGNYAQHSNLFSGLGYQTPQTTAAATSAAPSTSGHTPSVAAAAAAAAAANRLYPNMDASVSVSSSPAAVEAAAVAHRLHRNEPRPTRDYSSLPKVLMVGIRKPRTEDMWIKVFSRTSIRKIQTAYARATNLNSASFALHFRGHHVPFDATIGDLMLDFGLLSEDNLDVVETVAMEEDDDETSAVAAAAPATAAAPTPAAAASGSSAAAASTAQSSTSAAAAASSTSKAAAPSTSTAAASVRSIGSRGRPMSSSRALLHPNRLVHQLLAEDQATSNGTTTATQTTTRPAQWAPMSHPPRGPPLPGSLARAAASLAVPYDDFPSTSCTSTTPLHLSMVHFDLFTLLEGPIVGEKSFVQGNAFQIVARLKLRGGGGGEGGGGGQSEEARMRMWREQADEEERREDLAASGHSMSSSSSSAASSASSGGSVRSQLIQSADLQLGLALHVGLSALCQRDLAPTIRVINNHGSASSMSVDQEDDSLGSNEVRTCERHAHTQDRESSDPLAVTCRWIVIVKFTFEYCFRASDTSSHTSSALSGTAAIVAASESAANLGKGDQNDVLRATQAQAIKKAASQARKNQAMDQEMELDSTGAAASSASTAAAPSTATSTTTAAAPSYSSLAHLLTSSPAPSSTPHSHSHSHTHTSSLLGFHLHRMMDFYEHGTGDLAMMGEQHGNSTGAAASSNGAAASGQSTNEASRTTDDLMAPTKANAMALAAATAAANAMKPFPLEPIQPNVWRRLHSTAQRHVFTAASTPVVYLPVPAGQSLLAVLARAHKDESLQIRVKVEMEQALKK